MSEAPSRSSPFLKRLFSTIVLWSVVLAALLSPWEGLAHAAFLIVGLLLTAVGLLEFRGMIKKESSNDCSCAGVVWGAAWTFALFCELRFLRLTDSTPALMTFGESFLLAVIFLYYLVRVLAKRSNDALLQSCVGVTGVLYVAWLYGFIQKIYFLPGADGSLWVLYFIALTKFSDAGAYCAGSLFGRHKMIPRVSPGKTWEGLAGAVLVPVMLSVGFCLLFGERMAGLTIAHAVALGVLLSCGAVVGDLIESKMKRECGVKDSGNYLPGIGGTLDLLDSLLFNAPIFYVYLWFFLI